MLLAIHLLSWQLGLYISTTYSTIHVFLAGRSTRGLLVLLGEMASLLGICFGAGAYMQRKKGHAVVKFSYASWIMHQESMGN